MKILVITARYPPYHFGGYEIRNKHIIDELHSRGHRILVITSTEGTTSKAPHQVDRYKISRKLHIIDNARDFANKVFGLLHKRRFPTNGFSNTPTSDLDQLWSHPYKTLLSFVIELIFDLFDLRFIDRQIKRFQPDVIYLGHITNLSKSLMPYLAACSIPIVYDEGGSGLIDSWEERGTWYKFIHEYASRYAILNTIKPFVIKFVCKLSGNKINTRWSWPANMHIFFNSELNHLNAIARKVPVNGSMVIHSGINPEKFKYQSKTSFGNPLLLIIPGRIEPRKGQLDGVKLLATLREIGIDGNLIIVGESWSNSYYLELINEINKFSLVDKITIMSMITQDKLIDLYHKADICFFPSYFKTGFSRIPLEAMACGCILISYGNEGSDEIIRYKQTGFLVPSGDYLGMANIIREMITFPDLAKEIGWEARKYVENNHSMQKYVDRIDEIIINTAGAR